MKTKEEVEASPIFRIVKKGIMRKYPWIKNVISSDDESIQKYYSMLFLEAYVDIKELSEEMGWKMERWVEDSGRYTWSLRTHMDSPYLSMFFDKDLYDEVRSLQEDVDTDLKRIQKSEAIPSEYKIDKTMGFSNYRYKFPPPPPPQEEPLS